MNEHDFAELSAGHALGALSADDERTYQEALAAHPEWQSIADADLETTATLSDGVSPVAPPLAARSQLLARIRGGERAAETTVGDEIPDADSSAAGDVVDGGAGFAPVSALPPLPAEDPEHVAAAHEAADSASPEEAAARAAAPPTEMVQAIQRRNWTRGVFALVASIALLVGIGWGVGAITDAVRTPPAVKTLAQIDAAPDAQSASGDLVGDGEGHATLHWAPSVGEAVLVASGLPQIDDDRTFELWFVRDGTPVSAGTFDSSGGEATAQLTGEMEAGDSVAVTVEQRGGAPDGAPTTDPIVAITPTDA